MLFPTRVLRCKFRFFFVDGIMGFRFCSFLKNIPYIDKIPSNEHTIHYNYIFATNHKYRPMKKLILLAFAAFAFSCSSDDGGSSNNGGNNGGNNDAGVAYIKGKMNTVAFDYTFNNTANDTFLYNAMTGFSGEGFDRWYYYGGTLMSFTPPNFAPSFAIGWNNMYFGAGGDEEGEAAAFYETVGDLPSNFLNDAQDDAHQPGLEITYQSANGSYYTSKSGAQTGSTLAVSDYTQGMSGGAKIMTVVGTFSCKLYNEDDLTDVIEVTNGKFKLILTEFN